MKETKLILLGGLPGSGKTTLGKKLAAERGVRRFCTDDFMADQGLDVNDEDLHSENWKKLWKLAWNALSNGESILFEDGVWFRSERDEKRERAERLGVNIEFHLFDLPMEVLMERVHQRNEVGGHGVATITPEQMHKWAELYEKPSGDELALFDEVIIHRADS